MKKKKIFLILLLIVSILAITGCKKKVDKESDAYRFREEYMSINGTKNSSGKKIRTVTIPEENPFVYVTAEELVKKIDNKETFIVYFGFPTCPWCRSILEQLIKAAEDKKVEKIYYVNVLDIRDIKEVGEDGNITTTREGTEGYMNLLKQLDSVLEDYTLTKNEDTIQTGEKRIYAPNIIAISRGKAIQLETGISEELTDPYAKLTKNIKEYAYNKFKCLIKCLEEDSTTCKKNAC